MDSKSTGTAFVLSFLVVGGGQFYNGQVGKGFGMLIAAVFLGIFTYGILGIPFWIWSMVDAVNTAQNINSKSLYSPKVNYTNQSYTTANQQKSVSLQDNNKQDDDWIPTNQKPGYNYMSDSSKTINEKAGISVLLFKEQILKYKKLYDNGMFTYTEFSEMKAKYIDELSTLGIKESKEDFLLELTSMFKESALNEDDLSKIKSIILISK
ncbi:MAG: hypothetical protein ACOYN6_06690 [Ignavibacteria bacterium]